jgi:hypothetical protein
VRAGRVWSAVLVAGLAALTIGGWSAPATAALADPLTAVSDAVCNLDTGQYRVTWSVIPHGPDQFNVQTVQTPIRPVRSTVSSGRRAPALG